MKLRVRSNQHFLDENFYGKKAKCLVWFSAGKPVQTGEKTISAVLWALGQPNKFNIRCVSYVMNVSQPIRIQQE
jgi:hypothetical protein